MNLALLNLLFAMSIVPVAQFGDIPQVVDSVPLNVLQVDGEQVRGSFPLPEQDAKFSLNGAWQLSWDDTVGQALVGNIKACDIRFRVIDGTVTGEFVGPVAGTERNAIIDGQIVEHGDGYLLTFQQRESGYVCSYQICWPNSRSFTEALGVWHDTRGRSGNFSFLRYQ